MVLAEEQRGAGDHRWRRRAEGRRAGRRRWSLGSIQERSQTGLPRKTPQPNSAFLEAPAAAGWSLRARGHAGFRVPYRQGALIRDWRGRRPGSGCAAGVPTVGCQSAFTLIPGRRRRALLSSFIAWRIKWGKSTGRTDTQTFDSGVLEWPPWGTPQDPWGRGTCCHQRPHPLVSSPSIWFWVERGWESSNLFGPGALEDPLCSQILSHPLSTPLADLL